MTMPAQAPRPQRRMRPPSRYYLAHVVRMKLVTPKLMRVTLTADHMDTFTPGGPADSLKVTFPAPGEKAPSMPGKDAEGRTVYTPAQELQPRRAYTIRRWEASTHELDLDIVLHGHGPGAKWASTAHAGDLLVIGDPRMAYKVDPETRNILLAGDEAGLPAIATILEELPPSAIATVFAEVSDPGEEQYLPSPARVDITWLHRDARRDLAPGRLLAGALSDLNSPVFSHAWVACEAAAMREIRRHLLDQAQVDRTRVQTQGYWKYGLANHSDHDWGNEI